jgi:NTE family protein
MDLFRVIAPVVISTVFLSGTLLGCATIYNEPLNKPITGTGIVNEVGAPVPTYNDEILVGLAFSGGGTRAAAFAFGALSELDKARINDRGKKVSLLERVDFVSGVSGGSVTAAYFGLKKRAALDDFREKFLLRNAEESFSTKVNLVNLGRAFGGGVNDASGFPRWLDDNLFNKATFHEFRATRRPRIWINASDIYNRTPFIFGKTAFDALCSNLVDYPVSEAVAASAAVPVLFAPIVLEAYPDRCQTKLPVWIEQALENKNAQPLLRNFAQAIRRYRDGSMRYVKLLDGGLVDNYGLSGFSISLLSSTQPYEPLRPEQAARVGRILFLIADAGRAPAGNWDQKPEGPSGVELVMATADAATGASQNASYTAFVTLMNEWVSNIRRWRCSLSAAQRKSYEVGSRWRCNDLKLYVERIGFDQFPPDRSAALNAIPTRFVLPVESIDTLIASGAEAVRNNLQYKVFLKGL